MEITYWWKKGTNTEARIHSADFIFLQISGKTLAETRDVLCKSGHVEDEAAWRKSSSMKSVINDMVESR